MSHFLSQDMFFISLSKEKWVFRLKNFFNVFCGNDMATRGLTANAILIIQVIETIRTTSPLQKCYGFENRGRVGIN